MSVALNLPSSMKRTCALTVGFLVRFGTFLEALVGRLEGEEKNSSKAKNTVYSKTRL